jgi:hypothetical protein
LEQQEVEIRQLIDLLHVIGSNLKKINDLIDLVKVKETDLVNLSQN